MTRATAGLASALVLAGVLAPTLAVADDGSLYADCTAVEAIFSRGSGQEISASGTADDAATFDVFDTRLRTALETRFAEPVEYSAYEVGTGHDGHTYPAVAVDAWDGWFPNGLAAGLNKLIEEESLGVLSAAGATDYGKSVREGVLELTAYLDDRAQQCPDTRFVLAGFSQGAQVTGTVYSDPDLDDRLRDRIEFTALFGDPKLYLPEGEGWPYPPACRGVGLSEWRREVPDCDTDNGSLGARKPYLPDGRTGDVGLWCANDDGVCGSSALPLITGGHDYKQPGGGIDQAVEEIIARLGGIGVGTEGDAGQGRLATFPVGERSTADGSGAQDVAFVVDTTASMTDNIAGAKETARLMAKKIVDGGGRVALIDYRDVAEQFGAEKRATFLDGLDGFNAGLERLVVADPETTLNREAPEDMLNGLMFAFNNLSWQEGASKSAVVLTDAGYHDPDWRRSYTLEDVTERALQIDPVNVYPVLLDNGEASWTQSTAKLQLQELAEATGGTFINGGSIDGRSGDVAAALTEAIDLILSRPVVKLPMVGYAGKPREKFVFDASQSYGVGSEIVTYEWDFDADGETDDETTEARVQHVYDDDFDGHMEVRAVAADGGVGSMSAAVWVGDEPRPTDRPAQPEGLSAKVIDTAANGTSTVELAWTPADDRADAWVVAVDGVPVGPAAADAKSVQVTDVALHLGGGAVTFAVAGLTESAELGEYATVALEPPLPRRSLVLGHTNWGVVAACALAGGLLGGILVWGFRRRRS
jgi:hypothetical protein